MIMSDAPQPGEEMAQELIEWLFSRSKDSRMMIMVTAKTLAVLTCQNKPESISYAQQRKLFIRAITDELKCAAKFVESTKK